MFALYYINFLFCIIFTFALFRYSDGIMYMQLFIKHKFFWLRKEIKDLSVKIIRELNDSIFKDLKISSNSSAFNKA